MVDKTATIEVPENLQGFLQVEGPGSYDPSKFFMTPSAQEILDSIIEMQETIPMLSEVGIRFLNTTLLWGKPGTGKTAFGRYVASYMGWDFAYINFSKLVEGAFGRTSRNIGDVFEFMVNAKCVFMLDELDCIAVKRSQEGAGTGGELSRITITLMQELDYYKSQNVHSIIIGATNRKDQLDEALISRFATQREVFKLNNKEMTSWVCKYIDTTGIPYDPENIRNYVKEHYLLSQRNVEQDVIKCIGKWLHGGKQGPFILRHI